MSDGRSGKRGTVTSLYSSMRFVGVAAGPVVASLLIEKGSGPLFYTVSAVALLTAGVVVLSFHELTTASERVEGATAVLREGGFNETSLVDAPQKTTDVEGGFDAANVAITKRPQFRHWITVGINDESVLGRPT